FVALSIVGELIHQALDGIGNVGGGATIANRSRDRGKFANASADAEVIGVDHLAVLLDFLAFEADVGDPVLAAAIGAASDVDAKLLLEAGNAVVEFVCEPTRETLRFGERELAELGARASHCGASESGSANRQTCCGEFAGNADGVA